MKQIKVIGTGGIGTALLPFLCRYLNFSGENARVSLVDGDEYEENNAPRQDFKNFGNKAKVKVQELAPVFTEISFRAFGEYVTAENINRVIREDDIVLLAVDNHDTRKLISDHCRKLDNVILISGGNELTDGNVQVYIRQAGQDITTSLTQFHPEIENPVDRNPGEMSCAERANLKSSRQILVTNLMVATLMFTAFWLVDQEKYDQVGEYYFDLLVGKVNKVSRKIKEE